MMLSNEVVEKLGELLAQATPGPWRCTDGPVGYQHRVSSDDADGETVCDVERTGADAALISAAVNALPELLRVYRAWLDAPRVKLEERSATFGHGDHGREYVVGDDYMGRPAFAALVSQRVRLVRDGDSGEGESC